MVDDTLFGGTVRVRHQIDRILILDTEPRTRIGSEEGARFFAGGNRRVEQDVVGRVVMKNRHTEL